MLPISIIRENPNLVAEGSKNKNENIELEKILELDTQQRNLLTELNQKRALRNSASEKIGMAKNSGEDASRAISEMKDLSNNIKGLEAELANINEKIEPLLLWIPNLPHDSVPVGSNSESNVTIRKWGEKSESDFKLKNHLEIGEELKLFDFKKGAAIAGSGFPLYTGKGAKLERALSLWKIN